MATHINLLDWRAELRAQRKTQFFTMLSLGAVFSAAVVLVLYTLADRAIANQQARNTFLKSQIVEMDQKIKEIQEIEKTKASLLARMRVIEQLQSSRTATVHFFDEIVNTLPEGVYLSVIKQSGGNVTLEGVADSNGRVSTYMKNLQESQWFKDPKLIVIKTTEKNRQRQADFILQVKNLTKAQPSKAAEEELQ